ncbi:hypothetical protein [Chryseobacterium timonianum]|uniref:hypothetical protein n=1 Tax=Chryseobacterium timonianum TaxID=1805473 RepID=UPI001F4BBE74|nr:hypothetical protein [Chryseobacterium timonianum]
MTAIKEARIQDFKKARSQESEEATNQASNLAGLIDDTFDDVGFSYLQYFAF